ncbi:glycoside hydrolase family 16 protein [Piedraia hortae CBS 480.64]|uniref:Glycoside hydrolase family 16 protein n=1 Tax=Piedraia hortae CBS 480.64 TaxID=1314780 RepID=A0A6A7C4Z8_9PEZI|nr:glycoside hydrolase family 16 protein [Piedraia hortae CBS 480.64]
MDPSFPPDRSGPPHIRLNSADFGHAAPDDFAQSRPQLAAPTSRSLTGQLPGAPRPELQQHQSSNSLYQSNTPPDSAELLLPPRRSRTRRFRDDPDSAPRSPVESEFNASRRTSWSSSSVGSRDSRYGGPFVSPFDDSTAPSRAGSDDEGMNTQTVSDKYNILPSAGLLLFPEDVEKDDYLHNPDPNEKDRMDCSDLFSKRGLINVGGLLLITLGVLALFIAYPIITFVQKEVRPQGNSCAQDPNCLKENVPLLKNIRSGPIDPDTPKSARTRKGANGKDQQLVFSDEFNDEGRTFYNGDDPYFQAVDLWYGVTMDLEWYDPDAITTDNGVLAIRFDAFQNHGLNYRSGMLQSWNQLCFKGGYVEASISLPGRGDTIGFWPGFWSMGNLGRPGHAATTDGLWPYSYHDKCDVGITPNQSDPDGLNNLPGMRLPACTCEGEDHPTPGTSRSAPEIDALEASVAFLDPPTGNGIGSVSQSYQIAPFDIFWRPNTDFIEVYDRSISEMNSYQGGVFQQALSTLTNLNNDWYNGKAYQSYGFEYSPGEDGYVVWEVGGRKTWKVTGDAIGPNGNIGQRTISEEPMSLVMNFGMSNNFATLNLSGLGPLMPATMRIDYVRIYQDGDNELTCDPEGYPTTQYIKEHKAAYKNANYTLWKQAGYEYPKNSFMHGCKVASGSSSSKARRDRIQKRQAERESRGKWKRWLPWT